MMTARNNRKVSSPRPKRWRNLVESTRTLLPGALMLIRMERQSISVRCGWRNSARAFQFLELGVREPPRRQEHQEEKPKFLRFPTNGGLDDRPGILTRQGDRWPWHEKFIPRRLRTKHANWSPSKNSASWLPLVAWESPSKACDTGW